MFNIFLKFFTKILFCVIMLSVFFYSPNLLSMKRKRDGQNWFNKDHKTKRHNANGLEFDLVFSGIDEDFNTDLHRASQEGSYKKIKYLVDKGLSLYATNKRGRTPLHNFCARYLEEMDSGKIIKCMKLLIGDGRHVNWKCKNNGYRGQTPLVLLFSFKGERDIKLFKFLIDRGADVCVKDNSGLDTLNWAARVPNKNIDLIKFLIEQGANVNTSDWEGIALLSALEVVAFAQYNDFNETNKLVKMLIKYGVDVNLSAPFYKFLSEYNKGLLTIFGTPKEQIFAFLKTLFVNGADVDLNKLVSSNRLEELKNYLEHGTGQIRENYDTFRCNKKLLERGIKRGSIQRIKKAVASLKGSMMQDCISPYERLMILAKIVEASKKLHEEFISESKIFNTYLKRIPFSYDFFYKADCAKLCSLVMHSFTQAEDKFGRSIELVACNYPEHVITVFKRKPRLFFSGEANDVGTHKQVKSLLKYLVFDVLNDKREEAKVLEDVKKRPVLRKIRDKLVSKTAFYNYFLSSAGVYVALQQQCVLGSLKGAGLKGVGLDCARHIFSFLPGESRFAGESYLMLKNFVQSQNFVLGRAGNLFL